MYSYVNDGQHNTKLILRGEDKQEASVVMAMPSSKGNDTNTCTYIKIENLVENKIHWLFELTYQSRTSYRKASGVKVLQSEHCLRQIQYMTAHPPRRKTKPHSWTQQSRKNSMMAQGEKEKPVIQQWLYIVIKSHVKKIQAHTTHSH